MRKNFNSEHIEGRLYQHSIELKEVKNQNSPNFGKQFLQGSVEVAVDENGLNVIPVKFTYVTEKTKKGGTNKTYTELMKIMTSGKTWIEDGAEAATKVSIDTALGLNDFPAQDGTMVSIMEHSGGFLSVVGDLKAESLRATFKTDILITNVARIEADEERHIDEDYVAIRGAVFDFKNALLPVEYIVKNPEGMKFFEGLEASGANPVYTQVWGNINFAPKKISNTVESAFGEAQTEVRERKAREWIITGAKKVPYDFGDEAVMTEQELVKAMQDREVHLAEVKKRHEDYVNQKQVATPSFGASPSPAVPTPMAATPVGNWTF